MFGGKGSHNQGQGTLKDSFISLFLSQLITLLQLLISCAPVEPGQPFSRTLSSQAFIACLYLGKHCKLEKVNVSSIFLFLHQTVSWLFFLHMHTQTRLTFSSALCRSSSAPHPISSGPVCHQCGVFCRCDGASDADPDSRGLHAVCRGVLQCV